jgi:hypothetical protein
MSLLAFDREEQRPTTGASAQRGGGFAFADEDARSTGAGRLATTSR